MAVISLIPISMVKVNLVTTSDVCQVNVYKVDIAIHVKKKMGKQVSNQFLYVKAIRCMYDIKFILYNQYYV